MATMIVKYGKGGKHAVEMELREGEHGPQLWGRYIDADTCQPDHMSVWTEREVDRSDKPHVAIIAAIKEVLTQYSEADDS